jgi:mannosyltransferase
VAIASDERDELAMQRSDDQPMRDNRIWQHRSSLVIGAVIALDAGLRLYRLGDQGLFLDEAWSWAVSQLPVADLFRMSLTDRLPPLYFLLLKGWLLVVPATELGMRLFSVAWSVAALLLAISFVHRRWGTGAAVYAGWFMAISSFDVYYAQETRMYTLMGFCWLLSFVCLAEGVCGQPRLLLHWGIVNACMIWVQYAALPVVMVSCLLAVVVWRWPRQVQSASKAGALYLGAGLALSLAAAIPAVALLLRFMVPGGGGGTWLPGPPDLLALFALVTSGLTAARGYFLDSAHLALPGLAGVPDLAWAAFGVLPGALTILGLASAWRKQDQGRIVAFLAAALALGPVAGTYVLAALSGTAIWALKPFLGAAYLVSLWSGVGLSKVPSRIMRYGMAGAALAIALASFIPYYNGWQKTDAWIALDALPTASPKPAILLDRAYMAPVVYYYLGAGAEIWGISTGSGGATLVRVTPNGVAPESYVPAACDSEQFRAVTEVYLYPTAAGRALDERRTWPNCVRVKPTWIFQEGRWTPLGS